MNKMPNILHLTYDYANQNKGDSTVVINDLISNTLKISNPTVISLKRKFNIKYLLPEIIKINSNCEVKHFGFPYGILLFNISKYVSKILIKKCLNNDFDLIHAHKLTFEGFIGYLIAKNFNKPLILSIRQTDFYVLRKRPDLLKLSKNEINYASKIFIIAPYMKNTLKILYGNNFYKDKIEKKLVFLPNAIDLTSFKAKSSNKTNKYVTICWLKKDVVKRKNLYNLFRAIKDIEDLKLDIIGHGNYENVVRSWVDKFALNGRVSFLGFIPNEKIPRILPDYSALLLPSFSETFGVAYAEALASGLPILYSKGTGFDGLFKGVGVAVNPNSIDDIREGIINIMRNYNWYKNNILEIIERNELNIFSKNSVLKIYEKTILDILNF